MNWADYFYYDESSPSCLRWAVQRRGANNRLIHSVGAAAGYQTKGGYWVVGTGKKKYLVHRVIYQLQTGADVEGKVVDHVDGNPSNNVTDNLRLTTQAVNRRNSAKRVDAGEVQGVRVYTVKFGDYWEANWYDLSGKRHSKTFSASKYGYEAAKRMAEESRSVAIAGLTGVNGYTERHGK